MCVCPCIYWPICICACVCVHIHIHMYVYVSSPFIHLPFVLLVTYSLNSHCWFLPCQVMLHQNIFVFFDFQTVLFCCACACTRACVCVLPFMFIIYPIVKAIRLSKSIYLPIFLSISFSLFIYRSFYRQTDRSIDGWLHSWTDR